MKLRVDGIRILSVVLSVLAVCFHCVNDSVSGIETTNGDGSITAEASTLEGTASAFARVTLVQEEYLPVLEKGNALVTVADDAGSFRFADLDTGIYSVTVSGDSLGAHVKGIRIGADVQRTTHKFILRKPGTVFGRTESVNDTGITMLVYLAGTVFYDVVSAIDSFELGPVPSGEYAFRAARLHTEETYPEILTGTNGRDIQVPSGGRVDLGVIRME